jgi:hypothetical protein
MLRTIVIILVVLLFGLFAWVAFQASDITIVVNGQKLAGPAKLAAEGWGVLVATVVLFSAAILLVFAFAGAGLIILGALVLAGFLGLWITFPFLLPLLIPLLIVWLVVAAVRSNRQSGT